MDWPERLLLVAAAIDTPFLAAWWACLLLADTLEYLTRRRPPC
jgi:hypothetical protein